MGSSRNTPASLSEAVLVLKAYLERENADGKPIEELNVSEALLMTKEGVRWVMPFVLTAESLQAARHREAMR